MAGRLTLLVVALMLFGLAPAWATPGLAAGGAEEAALALVNGERARVGLAPMQLNPSLGRAAANHVAYYKANYGDPDLAGLGLHAEKSGQPGFTGAAPEDRAAAAGYTGRVVNENAGLTGNLEASLRWHIATVFHRLPLLDPRYTQIGFAAISEGAIRFDIVLVGAPEWPATASPDWVAWPPDGAEDVGLAFNGEAPDPFPGRRYPLGYPLTLNYFGPGTVAYVSASLRDAADMAVPIAVLQGTGWNSRRAALIAALTPLTRSTAYTVEVRGTIDGASFTRRWRFTTMGAATPPRAIAPPSATVPALADLPTATPTLPVSTPAATATPTSAPPPPTSSPTAPPSPSPTATAAAAIAAARKEAPPPPLPLPPGVAAADPAVADLWRRVDGPAAAGQTTSWLFGPDAFTSLTEPYSGTAAGRRAVYYFDKSRLEVNDPLADRAAAGYVTSGLLARELVTGAVQVGDQQWEQRAPASLPVVGDLSDNPNAPGYATFAPLISRTPSDNRVDPLLGSPITATLGADGHAGSSSRLGRLASVGAYSDALGHNIPTPFWTWLSQLDPPWTQLIGLPISEAYWVRASVGGIERDVLVQIYERRVLTFTPDNPEDWRVEMGNVGRHYYAWRYGT